MTRAAEKPALMECGHSPNAQDGTGKWVCVICTPRPEAARIAQLPPIELEGRTARCSCGAESASDAHRLAFFEYRGPGSAWATEGCECGYARGPHDAAYMEEIDRWRIENGRQKGRRQTVIERGVCTGWRPRGPAEHDGFYCGCRGWD